VTTGGCIEPQDLTEWHDFIEFERQKSHTPDALKALNSQMSYVPTQVWVAIAA